MNNLPIIDGTGTQTQVKTTESGGVHTTHHNIDAMPLQHVDAFSRIRTSDPGYRFDSQLTYQIDSDLWDTKVTGDGAVTYDSTNRMAAVSAGTTAGANTAIFQGHYHAPYSPGRGQLCFVTFSMPDTVPTNGEVGCGYYDGSNGVYLKKTAAGLTLNVTTTTAATDDSVAQASWNIDPLDGTGPSGLTLDVTKTCILVVQLQALYVGLTVVGFDIGGSLVPVHSFHHANIFSEPYIAQASLPVRYWASTSTDATAVSINAICSSVISEGGQDLQDISGRTYAITGENLDVDAAAEAVLIIQPKQQLNSINQNAIVIPTELDVSVGSAGCWIEIRRNVTGITGTPTSVGASSVVNYVATPTATAGTGTLLDAFYIPAAATVRGSKSQGLGGKVVLSYSHLLAAADNLAVMAYGGANSEVRASLKWKEIR